MERVTLAENVEAGGALGAYAHAGFEGALRASRIFLLLRSRATSIWQCPLSLNQLWVKS